MAHTVFFSWQLDRAPRCGRNFIERALERAIGQLGDSDLDVPDRGEVAIDRDTMGVAGQPPIVDTIYEKVDRAAVFVPDLTFVGTRVGGRPTPNPNVLIEFGRAQKSIGHGRIVAVMNTAHGLPTAEDMPFDLRHLRNPITYHLPDDADEGAVRVEREKLAKALAAAIGAVFRSDGFLATLPKPAPPPEFPAAQAKDGLGRFRAPGKAIGAQYNAFSGTADAPVRLREGPCIWLRAMPTVGPAGHFNTRKLNDASHQNPMRLMPIFWGGSLSSHRAADGFGMHMVDSSDQTSTGGIAFVFETGEVWAIDTYFLTPTVGFQNSIPHVEEQLVTALRNYGEFLTRLGFQPPYRWIAGAEGINGMGIIIPPAPNHISIVPGPRGTCMVDSVVAEGVFDPADEATIPLLAFFERLYDACGFERPLHLNAKLFPPR